MEKMFVNNIFNMSFGKAFFVGYIEGGSDFITASQWRLLVNDKLVREIEIEGEQIPLRKAGVSSSERVLACIQHVDKSGIRIGVDNVRLEKIVTS